MDLTKTKALLHSPELAEIQAAILDGADLKIVPENFATPFQKMLSRLQIGADELLALFRAGAERDRFVRFCRALQKLPEGAPDGEFPPGEEPGPDDRSNSRVVVGVQNGFALYHACDYLILEDPARGPEALKDFYKWRRMPSAARAARETLKVYEGL